MIVKHRRGTTEEWLAEDPVPEDGELVIEECDDGTRKYKTGTGDTCFSELPYIDDATKAVLRKELAESINVINNQLNAFLRSNEKLSEADAEIYRRLDSEKAVREAAFAELSRMTLEADKALQEAAENLQKEVASISDTLTTRLDILTAKASATDQIANNVNSQLSAAINTFDKKIEAQCDNFDNKLIETTRLLSTDYNAKVNTLTENLQSTSTDLDTLTAEFDSSVVYNKAHFKKLNNKITAQAKRIDNLVAPEESTLTLDDEVRDIRVGHDGTDYASAGTAVRAIGNEVNELRDSLSSYIDTQAISGLHYDTAGEVGLKQPYMLYLTAGNEIIQDSGVQIISGAGGGGGSTASSLKIGYITTSPVIAAENEQVILEFTFSGTDSSGDTILRANATWKVNDNTVAYDSVRDGKNSFDITKYLSVGTTKVLLIVTDDNGSTVTKTWSIQQISLTVSSDFNDKSYYPAGEELLFTYTPNGSVKKYIIFELDGEQIDRVELGADISGEPKSYRIPPQAHGAHLLEFYLEADIDGDTKYSNHVLKDLLFYDIAGNVPVIGCSTPVLKTKQYAPVNIIYTVYDPNADIPTVDILIDGKKVSTRGVSPNPDYNNTPTGVYSYTEAAVGVHTVEVVCGPAKKTVTVEVESLGINISPVTAGLAFDFNPVGRDNDDTANRLWSYNDIHMAVSENFDWVNGGYKSEKDTDGNIIPGTEHFCIKAGSTATIDYELFANDAKKFGKEFKLIFKTKNVANPEAVFLSCLDGSSDKDYIGVEMGVHAAHIYGQNGNLELAYSEEDMITFEFNISRDSEKVLMVMGYEDGVPSRPMVYDPTYSFTQNNPKIITIGSPDCDTLIYRFKVYNTSLTNSEILDNFIADASTAEEMISRYNRNQIYNENHKLTPEVLAEKCPWLRVYKVSAPHFTNNKSDKVKNTTIQQLYKNGDPILDNWTSYNAQHSGQGTSSNNYGAAGRNLDFIMNKDGAYFELGDGTRAEKISLTRESVPVAYLNAKVNIASSNNLTNAILANRYNRFNPYKRPFVEREGININHIKDTMEFYNCVIFIQETDPDLSTHREFADTDWHFYAIGNIGDSKKTDNTRATDPDDKYECCVEIMDVGLPLSDFPVDTMMNAMGYKEDEATKEKIYTWAKDENLGILYEKQEDGSYELTTDTVVDLTKTYYVDILEHDDFSEDYTYGWRYISDDEDPEVVNTCKQAWIDFYRFVTTSTDEEFRANLKDYFVVDSALYYYLFTTRYCMVDNRAKNTFWHYGKAADGTYKFDLCWDYDNDTSLGLNNYGKQVYRYGLEDIDVDDAGVEVFRESDSTFFCRIRDLFGDKLQEMYQDLESADAWHAESFIKECDEWQDEFPEELWRLDINRKYIRTYNTSFINGAGDKQFLTNMCNGKMKYHRRQWERSQEQYMASKYQTTMALDDKHHVNFRVNRFESTDGMVVTPNYQFTLTPNSYIYLNVKYGGTKPISVRAEPNVETVVPFSGELSADIINVGSAAAISDFGDLSALYPHTASIQNATRVKKLTLGNKTAGYANTNFTSLETGDNTLLEELDISNITSYSGTLLLNDLVNLKKLYAFGTNLSSVTFADGGKLSYVELPAVNNLKLKNLMYLSTDNLKVYNDDYSNVIELTVEDCELINQLALFEKCYSEKLKRVRLIGVDFGTTTYDEFSRKLFHLNGLSATGETTTDAILEGSIHFDNLSGEQFNELKKRYSKLQITYGELKSTITFKDTDGKTTVYSDESVNAADCNNPVYYGAGAIPEGMIAKPIKSSTAEFDYDFLGWSTAADITILSSELNDEIKNQYQIGALTKIEGDKVFYPVFVVTRRKYIVEFKHENKDLFELELEYGPVPRDLASRPNYREPTKEAYEFNGWITSEGKAFIEIIGPTICYADFKPTDIDNDNLPGYTIGWTDISDCVDSSGNLYNGYVLNEPNATMSITKCKNNLNSAIYIPDAFTLGTSTYKVTELGGFSGHSKLEIVRLPGELVKLSTSAFSSCTKLTELELPETLQVIAANALQACTKLKTVTIPANVRTIEDAALHGCSTLESIVIAPENTNFVVIDGCLIDTRNKKLLQGLTTSTIPQDGSVQSLGHYCFANMPITSIEIPNGITVIANNAFSRCEALESVTLPNTVTKLDATCFAWCLKLTEIELHEGLTDIMTYVFNSCPLKEVIIPASVNNINEKSFGSISTLQTVTFKKALKEDGSIKMPYIHQGAFYDSYYNSGNTTTPIVFNVPWSEEEHMTQFAKDGKDPTFGARAAVFNYNYVEEAN